MTTLRQVGRSLRWIGALSLLTAVAALSSAAVGAPAAPEQPLRLSLGAGTRATALTSGSDGNLWFAGPTTSLGAGFGDVVGRLTTTGELTEFPLSHGEFRPRAGAPAIVTGPDGSLYFAHPDTNSIGRVTTAGQITNFPLPTSGSRPSAIVGGPGGDIWFTEEGADRVGRLDPAGKIEEFMLPSGARPGGIALGPDGNLWITEKGLGRIVRLTVTGSIAEFQLPDAASLPAAIVAGPDGNLWFTEEAEPRIGRITRSGEIEEFRVPGGQGTEKLSVGPGGDLWFTVGNKIASITPAGIVGEPACAGFGECSFPIASLAVGPDGGLWFGAGTQQTNGGGATAIAALYAGGLVGRFSPAPPEAEVGRHAGNVAGTRTSLDVACTGGTAGMPCVGRVRLIGGSPSVVLAQRRYRLLVGTSARFPLSLTRRAVKLLRARGSLVARVNATVSGGRGASRRILIRASFQRP